MRGLRFLSIAIVLAACNEVDLKQQERSDSEKNEIDLTEVRTLSIASKVIYTMPSPMEMASILKKTGLTYDSEVMADHEGAKNQMTTFEIASNLGLYFSDLSYSSQFNQAQEAMNYMVAIQRLGDQLGITSILNENTVKRLEDNSENKDSLVAIVSEVYFDLDASLQEDNKHEVSAMMFVGAWVEGMHIACSIAGESEEIRNKIADQANSLNNLTKMLDEYPENTSLLDFNKELKALLALFPGGEKAKVKPVVKKQEGKSIITIGGAKSNLSNEDLLMITKSIVDLRTKIL
jgi:hypothetical protein